MLTLTKGQIADYASLLQTVPNWESMNEEEIINTIKDKRGKQITVDDAVAIKKGAHGEPDPWGPGTGEDLP